jgi:hypothetical protein
MKGFGPEWSGDSQILANTNAPGDYIVLAAPVEDEGTYEVSAYFTKADDFGQIQLIFDGEPMGAVFDGYNDRVIHTGRLSMGRAYLKKGDNPFRFQVVGKRKSSENYYFGIDCFILRRVAESNTTTRGGGLYNVP